MDLTKQWSEIVRALRQSSSAPSATGTTSERVSGASAAAVVEALTGPRWRTPLTPFMQQATELNYSIQEMHTFLLERFLDYVDLYHSVPSKRSLMTEGEKDLIDLEVTSFMTACAAGVDALKALLQRERLRRMEQEAAAGAAGVGDEGGDEVDAAAGAELRPGSRPAHEHAAVTFLFERLKAVTAVAETMQAERHKRAAAKRDRFYEGPAAGGRIHDSSQNASGSYPPGRGTWCRTAEELEEERLLEESLPGGYGTQAIVHAHDKIRGVSSDTGASDAPFNAASPDLQSPAANSGSEQPYKKSESNTAALVSAFARENRQGRKSRAEQGSDAHGFGGVAGAGTRWGGGSTGEEGAAEGRMGSPVIAREVLEGENRDLVARMKNELDDARLVETKMSEISGLMGLFASKVVEQQGDMEHVLDTAVSTNDKLVRGGEHLEKALSRGGTFRFFYAWFMLGASFCLLFLHFYRP